MDFKEYKKMVLEVNRLRQEIHLFNNEEISESALDDLKHKITIFEQENPTKIIPSSPNYVVAGGVLKGFEKEKHARRMISIGDVFDEKELSDWDKRWKDFLFAGLKNEEIYGLKKTEYFQNFQKSLTENKLTKQKELFASCLQMEYICEPKIDGMSISLHYEEGQLKKAITRGDGFVGENVTENIKMIASVPKHILDQRKMEIRGELFINKRDFEELNAKILRGEAVGKMGKTGESFLFANARNAVAGSIRNLNTEQIKNRKISFIAYACYVEE